MTLSASPTTDHDVCPILSFGAKTWRHRRRRTTSLDFPFPLVFSRLVVNKRDQGHPRMGDHVKDGASSWVKFQEWV
ncbi:hypothetical protein SERLA73DRAFT_182213 [Serpula lacrymans var. lacrymans S7.3]|uniref:Uncharacterized protein n=1 Tax=Serpula lacrymans var. lacrymans (strain S7.3) TaxID=936435 RepID=F8PWV2_SERL3|nr:hypothetical protein SERLA73DRAFT_182213 [Serpula lacrymans var. lacrymans S7.3]